jgi:UDP-N-acetylmuramate dehydrogenase
MIKNNEPLAGHTTFKIGGPADVMVFPRSIDDVQKVISCCRENNYPLLVMGLGSNLLVRDKGFRGVVLKVGNSLKEVIVQDETIHAQAGISMAELAAIACAHSLGGLEFAEGIPGSLGGAVVMNAGAYGGEMKDVVTMVEAVDRYGAAKVFTPADIHFGYRKSIFQNEDYIILAVRIKLHYDDQTEIRTKMDDLANRRRDKQPLDLPSAGSTFRRPEGFFVGPMIEELGLKGRRIGGAEVSSKHAGFIVNVDQAKADDVLQLINLIRKEARERLGVELIPEIRIVGEE